MRIAFTAVFVFLLTAGAPWGNSTRAGGEEDKANSDPESTLKHLRELHRNRGWKELMEHFGKSDPLAWPREFASQSCEALRLRGDAYSFTKNGQQAEADYQRALKIMPDNANVWMSRADNFANNLLDDPEALTAYREVFKITGKSNGWMPISATLSIARILTNQVKPDEALATLQKYGEMEGMPPVWRVKMLRAYGHAYAALGKEQESLEKFREALKLESLK